LKRSTVTAPGFENNSRSEAGRKFRGAVSRPIVCDDDFSVDSKTAEALLRLANA
jgi:hypothetical protein